ncbi:MAG: prolyl oligopeptidase family serine peptidase, partial [Verrucomicrobiales bacterium]|nr:prolyl oligopeptidase family serine peptidase [Verrucomicrobiales bacterium]
SMHTAELKDGALFLDGEKIADAPGDGWKWEGTPMWSRDSTRFAVWKNTSHPVHEVHFVESAPKDQLQPKHLTHRYPKPGDKLNNAVPVIFFVDGRDPIEVKPELIEDPFSFRKFGWRADSERFVFEFIERGFGSFRVIEINTETGKQRALIDETDEKFVFVFGNTFRRDLKGGEEVLWLSERDGWNHLYLIDGKTGEIIRQLTNGEWIVREVVEVNESNRTAIAKICGHDKEQDPYCIHFAKIDLDTGELIHLTDGDGTHELSWSPDGSHFLAKWSRVDHPPVHEIRRFSDGKKIATIAEAKGLESLEKAGWQKPERFVAKCRNDEFDIHGVIFRPVDFDPEKSYPVVEAIYAGPHGSFTPKNWRIRFGGMDEMADAGFIVVKLDGLGTNYRGKKFQQVAYKNLIDSGLPDRVKWMQAAAKQVPQMDLERVGIYGGSAGGQSTLAALLTHPDFYRAGAADCGCHDNRMDKIWWNEQWMDWPIGEHYEENSNVTHIEKLRGNLLLTVGELDKNVDPASTLQVVDALIKADRDFEFILVPGAGHGVGESPHLRRKRIEFFQRHLGGPE